MTTLCELKDATLAEPRLDLEDNGNDYDGAIARLSVVDSGCDIRGVASIALDAAGARKLALHLTAWADRQEPRPVLTEADITRGRS